MEQIQNFFNIYRPINDVLRITGISSKRDDILQNINAVLEHYGLSKCIRGSWKHGDFHVNNHGLSFSDIDLMCPGIEENERQFLITNIASRIESKYGLIVPVSIHPNKSLVNVSMQDAKLLCFPEYLYQLFKSKKTTSTTRDYINAKFSLLILRKTISERYQDTHRRINTKLSEKAFLVKLGYKNNFSTDNMISLLGENDELTSHFIEEYVLQEPTAERIRSCFKHVKYKGNIDYFLIKNIQNKFLSIGMVL